jgi:hypothetical protein
MNFTANALIKAILAGLFAFAGAIGAATASHNGDLANLDAGSWVLACGSALTAAGALLHTPEKKTGSGTTAGTAAGTVTDIIQATTQGQQDLTTAAVDSINAVIQAAGKLLPTQGIPGATIPGATGTLLPPGIITPPASGASPILSNVPIIGGDLGSIETALGPLAGQVIDQVLKAA